MCTFQRGSISCAGNGQRQGQFLLCSVETVPSSLPECLGSAPLRLLPPIWDRNVATQSLILGLLISLKSIFFFNRCFQNNEVLERTHYWNAGGLPNALHVCVFVGTEPSAQKGCAIYFANYRTFTPDQEDREGWDPANSPVPAETLQSVFPGITDSLMICKLGVPLQTYPADHPSIEQFLELV